MTVILVIIIIIIVFWFLSAIDQHKMAQWRLQREKEEEAAIAPHKQYVANLKSELTYKMYAFGRKNLKIRKTYYDIEEGGDYVTEFNKLDCEKIDLIIKEELRTQSMFFYDELNREPYYRLTVFPKTIETIEKRILAELKSYTKSDEQYLGFD